MIIRIFGYLFGLGAVVALLAAGVVGYFVLQYQQELPDYEVLAEYEPGVMTRIHAGDGALIGEYAEERRLYLPIQAIPARMKAAFISAEDKNFYQHNGIDPYGLARAVLTNVRNIREDRRLVGASTITQQVAKNFLLTNERTIDRKIKEALLALRIEQAFSKDQILELYLNEIYFGLGAYGVAAAALVYFDKSVHELSLAETAYIAALPKAPNNYHPFKHTEKAIDRRNYVVREMVDNGYVEGVQGEIIKAMPLEVNLRRTKQELFTADYFTEEVRRQLLERYGERKLYGGGLSVRTSVDLKLQALARRTLIDGLIEFDEEKGWRGPVQNVELGADWALALEPIEPLTDVGEWTQAVVLDVNADQATIGLRPLPGATGGFAEERQTASIPLGGLTWAKWEEGDRAGKDINAATDVLNVGDVIYVEKAAGDGNLYRLRQPPAVDGGLVAMDPHTGRVLAMVGGFSFASSQFNRATQAKRQPGSSFKPFVYAAALDNGYTPSSVVMDAPISVNQGGNLGIWRPTNYGGKFYGPSTLRLGIERSRNVMTVRLAKDMGMPLIAEYARRFGIYDDMLPVLSMSLGAGETTLLRMVSAYAVLANGGRRINPTLIDRIQDRYGKTIFMHDERVCENCQVAEWNNQLEPAVLDNRDQVLDPMTAYQITSMMEGVISRGTAPVVRQLKRPVAGKTGTTNDELDAWFVGYTPDMVVGVFVGYDQPKPMGRGATGGNLAAPIFTDFMTRALKDKPKVQFRVPDGLNLIPINRRTGLRVIEGGNPEVILEAFKPGTSPPDNLSIIGFEEDMGRAQSISLDEDRAVVTGTGGLY